MSGSSIGSGGFKGLGTHAEHTQLQSDVTTTKGKQSGVDSVAKIESNRIDSLTLHDAVNNTPVLQESTSKNPSALMALAAAMGAIFTSMAEVADTSSEGLSQGQDLANIQAKTVMASATNAINKENAAYKHYQQVEAEANNPLMKDLGWIFMGVMAAVLVATIASGFLTGGASELAAPEEISAMTGEATAEAGGETAATTQATMDVSEVSAGIDDTADTSVEEGVDATEARGMQQAGEEGLEEGVDEGATTAGNLEDTADSTQTINMVDSNDDEASDAEETEANQSTRSLKKAEQGGENSANGLSKGKKIALALTGSGFGVASGAVMGVYSLKLHASYKALANLQRSTGAAAATQSYEQASFKFLNTASQRTSKVVMGEIGNTTTVIQSYAKIISNYSQAYANAKNAQPA